MSELAVTKETLQLKTAQAMYDIPASTCRRHILAGLVKGNKVKGKWYVNHADLKAFMRGDKDEELNGSEQGNYMPSVPVLK